MIYFDHAATTNLEPEVYDFLVKSLNEDFANPSSAHKLGKVLQEKIQNAKLDFLKMLGAKNSDHFYFTASATEANNTIIKGLKLNSNDAIVFSMADHKSIVEPILKLKSLGVELINIRHYNDGTLQLESLAKNDQVKLVVLTHVNNQSGTIVDLNSTAKLIKELYPKSHLHVDMVQSFTKLETKINSYIDSISIAAHKIGGPKGVGGLFLKAGHKISSLIDGGGQQADFRSGTETYSLDFAFKLAADLRLKTYLSDFKFTEEKMNILKTGIKNIIPNTQFPFTNTSPYILCFVVPKISSDILLRHLEQKNVYLSSTSACSSKVKGFNPTLAALGLEEMFHKNVLRLSISKHTSNEEIAEFLSNLETVWSDLKYLIK